MSSANRLIEYTNADYYKTATIPPPEDDSFYDGETRITRIVVDSKDRNLALFPNPNLYDMVFDDEIHDVVSAQLISMTVKMRTYLINNFFNTLSIRTNGNDTYFVVLSNGDYSASDLAAEIAFRLNTCIPNVIFTCAYVVKLDNYIISSNGTEFSIDFTIPNSLAMMLGFGQKVYQSIGNVMSSEFRKDFHFNNYIVMFINQFDINKNQSNPLNRSFAVIPTSGDNDLTFSDLDIVKYFSPPVSKINKIQVSFFDRYGNPYDFQNKDHRYEIIFKSHKLRRKYGPIMKNHMHKS